MYLKSAGQLCTGLGHSAGVLVACEDSKGLERRKAQGCQGAVVTLRVLD